ncbi:MAG: ATPase AAA [Candidatus Xenobia bacterium]
MFLNRERELEFLECWWSRGAGLAVLYGRRRIGKTELLRQFARRKPALVYVAAQTTLSEQLREFSAALEEAVPEAAGVSFADWTSAWRFLAARSTQPLLLVLDEFPYLAEADPALPSVIQRAWDGGLKDSQLRVVLCGSSISVMERSVLAEKSPLFGRRTAQYLLESLDFREAGLFFPRLSTRERFHRFAVLGGVPAYCLQFDPEQDLWDGVRDRILAKGAFLRDEVTFLLMQELREPRLYMAILTAIAEGRTRLGEIANRALGPSGANQVSFYLQTLQTLGLIERVVPLTESQPHKSRRGLYRLRDPFVRFWFRYVFPEQTRLEMGLLEQVLEQRIRPDFASFCAPVFEECCRQSLLRARLAWSPARVGSWWSASSEVDVVAWDVAQRNLLVGECKWSGRPVGENVLADLDRNSHALIEELSIPTVWRALFAPSFTPALERRAHQEGLLLFSLDELYG